MVLASKLLSQERTCEEFLARAKDQLLSIGTGSDNNNIFKSFNVMRSAKFNHHLREKGSAESLTPVAATAPQVVKQRLHPSINSKLAGPKVSQREELLSDLSLVELEAVCGTYYVPDVHPDSPDYAPDRAVARDYLLWLTTSNPADLRQAYKEMENQPPARSVIDDPFWFRFQFQSDYVQLP